MGEQELWFEFYCRLCGHLSDDGKPWDKICMGCADELDELERLYYDIEDRAAD